MSGTHEHGRSLVGAVLESMGVIAVGGSLAAALGSWGWPFDLATSFPLQWSALCLLTAVGAVVERRPWWWLVSLLLLAAVGPVRVAEARRAAPQEQDGQTWRVVTYNVLTTNPDRARSIAWLAALGADVACLPETDMAWARDLAGVQGMRVAAAHPQSDNFGMVLLVGDDVEIVDVQVRPERPVSITATLARDGTELAVVAAHPVAPIVPRLLARRDHQLEQLAAWSGAQPGASMICGDFNITPWSATGHTARDLGMGSVRDGHGTLGTWPVPLRWLGLVPIDHIWVRGVGVRSAHVGPALGSDHLPLWADVVVPLSR